VLTSSEQTVTHSHGVEIHIPEYLEVIPKNAISYLRNSHFICNGIEHERVHNFESLGV